MNHRETIRLFVILTIAYPKFDTFQDAEKLDPIINLWTEMFSDVPYPIVETAVKKLILESPYPPAISDVRKQIADITNPDSKIDPSTAWGEVTKAIRIYGYPRPQEALESMSPITRKVVESLGWQEICQAEQSGVVRGQFLKMYEAYSSREKRDALLPQSMKNIINQIGQTNQKRIEGE